MSIELSVHLNTDVHTAWRELRDVERWPRWTASMSTVQRLEDGPLDVGSRVRIKQPGMPAMVWSVTTLAPLRGFTWTTRSIGITTVASHELTAAPDGGTRLRLSVRHTGPLARVIARAFRRRSARFLEQEAAGLKSAAEHVRCRR